MRGQIELTSADADRDVKRRYIIVLCSALILSLPLATAAQAFKEVKLEPEAVKTAFKLKLTRDLTSGRVRVGDYVQFQLIEAVKYPLHGGLDADTIIEQGTPVYGQVVDRSRRFTGLKKGRFGIGNLWTTTRDGTRLYLTITRPDMPSEDCENKFPKRKREAEWEAAKRAEKYNAANGQAEQKTELNQPQKQPKAEYVPCIKGRVYASTLISSLPSALLAVGTATLLTGVKDDATSAVVAITLADKIATQSGLSNIINGVDAEIGKDEIFDATINLSAPLIIKVPVAGGQATKDVERVGRFTAPTPPGYIITNYFSDVVKYPITPSQPTVYTGKIIERYRGKPLGSKMNVCEPQSPPDGWVAIDRGVDPAICPREPGDPKTGYSYSVIMRMH